MGYLSAQILRLSTSTHRLRHGLRGYQILFATRAFVPQRQY
jgi:hypothetical protein